MGARRIAVILFASAACGASAGLWGRTQSPAWAGTVGNAYYVSPAGRATNDGSQDRPWPTAAYALGKVGGGNTIILAPGTYAPILVPRGCGGTAAHPTVIQSQAKWQAVIDGALHPAEEGLASETPGPNGTTNYATFDGFKVVNAGTFGINLGGDWNVAQNCWVIGSKHTGIGSWGHKCVTIRNNLIEHNGTSSRYDHGVYATGKGLVVTGNIVRHNSACGIDVITQGPAPSTLSGNLVYDNLINMFLEGDVGSGAVTNNTLLNTTNNPLLLSSIDEIRTYGPNLIGVWSGNRVESSVSGASLDGVASNRLLQSPVAHPAAPADDPGPDGPDRKPVRQRPVRLQPDGICHLQ